MVECGLDIFPSLISNLSSKSDQENMMKSVSGIAEVGCAVSLQCNNDGYKAIRILELSRGAINRLTINSRADEFQILPSKDRLLETSLDQSTVLLNTTRFRTDAVLIYSNKRIQVLPLDLSIYQRSIDYHSQIRDRFGSGNGNDRAWENANTDMRSFLEWLWEEVVGPVLHAFQFRPLEALSKRINAPQRTIPRRVDRSQESDLDNLSQCQSLMVQHPNIATSISSARHSKARSSAQADATGSKVPRVHWIGIAHMAAFPFHAAGYGYSNQPQNTMSCVISSYASTLAARAYAKQKPVALESRSSALLLVAMPKTPNQNDLPGVGREVTSIEHTVPESIAVKVRKLPPKKVILDDLPLYDSVHFACHGFADPQSPFRSGLLLCGNEPEKSFEKNTRESILTVENISSINTERSQLAFLSACCTAENASMILMDEGIHLAGGFQLAGYPHVIASLWEADDLLSVEVAKKFYQTVFEENKTVGHERIAYALHTAISAARQVSNDPLDWAPTIHFGP